MACVGCDTERFKHGLVLPKGALCPSCIRFVNEERPPRRPAHDLETCIICHKNIDVCCSTTWQYIDVEEAAKAHGRCMKVAMREYVAVIREASNA